MIEKAVTYKNTDKDFIINLKKLGLSKDEINLILKKYKRKKFEGGGDGGGGDGGGDGGSGDGGSGDGGSSGDSGDSGASGGGAAASGGGGDDGAGASAAGDAGVGTGDSAGVGGSGDSTSGEGVGSGPGGEEGTGGVSAANAADAEADTGIVGTIGNIARQAIQAYAAISPTAIAMNAIANAISNAQRGVTAPNDHSQATTSVQSGAPNTSNTGGGGITTIQPYAPLYNTSTGDNTGDSLVSRLNAALKTQPAIYGIPSVSPYSNYTLLDLYNNKYI